MGVSQRVKSIAVGAAAALAVVIGGAALVSSPACGGPCVPTPEAARWPEITGTAEIGQVLSTDNGTWVVSGNLAGHPNTSTTFQWLACTPGTMTCSNAGGTPNSCPNGASCTYSVVSGDQSKEIRVRVTATNDGGITTQLSGPTPTVPSSGAPADQIVPYDAASAFNTTVAAAGSTVDANNTTYLNTMNTGACQGPSVCQLTADTSQYTPALEIINLATQPWLGVTVNGSMSTFDQGDNSRYGHGSGAVQPMPYNHGWDHVDPRFAAEFSDAQTIAWDPNAGLESDCWQWQINGEDVPTSDSCSNANIYHTKASSTKFCTLNGGSPCTESLGTPHTGIAQGTTYRYYGHMNNAGRGGGTAYLEGLVRPWEMAQGHIDHALAWAYAWPRVTDYIWPATKTDGTYAGAQYLPEGIRMVLKASVDLPTVCAGAPTYGGHNTCEVIGQALKTYGAFMIDHAGSAKVYLEANLTAQWYPGNQAQGVNTRSWTNKLTPGNNWDNFQFMDTPQGAEPAS